MDIPTLYTATLSQALRTMSVGETCYAPEGYSPATIKKTCSELKAKGYTFTTSARTGPPDNHPDSMSRNKYRFTHIAAEKSFLSRINDTWIKHEDHLWLSSLVMCVPTAVWFSIVIANEATSLLVTILFAILFAILLVLAIPFIGSVILDLISNSKYKPHDSNIPFS